jgi:ABC-type antimicrobial peptide transport system ATPase subunit
MGSLVASYYGLLLKRLRSMLRSGRSRLALASASAFALAIAASFACLPASRRLVFQSVGAMPLWAFDERAFQTQASRKNQSSLEFCRSKIIRRRPVGALFPGYNSVTRLPQFN